MRQTKIFFLFLIGLVLAATFGYAVRPYLSSVIDTEPTENLDEKVTYKNETYGIAFDYPKSWVIESPGEWTKDPSRESLRFHPVDEQYFKGVGLSIETTDVSLEEAVDAVMKDNDLENIQHIQWGTTVAGESAIAALAYDSLDNKEAPGGYALGGNSSLYVVHGGFLFTFYFGSEVYAVHQMLSSVRFFDT